MATGLRRTLLRPCLVLLLAEHPSYGYDLLEQMRDLGLERIDRAGVYRTLRSMEEEGLVESEWEPSSTGPARRIYTLTEQGRDWLDERAGTLRETVDLLHRYLSRYDRISARDAQSPA